MARHTRLVARVGLVAAAALLASGCGGRSTAAELHHLALSVSDLPAGWSAAPTKGAKAQQVTANAPCFSSLHAKSKGLTYDVEAFTQGGAIPTFVEVLAAGPQLDRTWKRFTAALASCRSATIDLAGTKVKGTVRRVAFPPVGDSSSASAWAFTFHGVRIGFDLVLFRVGKYGGYVTYSDLGAAPARDGEGVRAGGGGEGGARRLGDPGPGAYRSCPPRCRRRRRRSERSPTALSAAARRSS